MLRLHAQGFTLHDIGEALGMKVHTVSRYVRANIKGAKVTMGAPTLTLEMIELIKEGCSFLELVRQSGLSKTGAMRAVKATGPEDWLNQAVNLRIWRFIVEGGMSGSDAMQAAGRSRKSWPRRRETLLRYPHVFPGIE